MNKKEVQERVLQNGKKISLEKFKWDEKTNVFSTLEDNLVVDFTGISYCTFKTGSDCTFKTGSGCTFKTGSDCTFKTGYGCTFNTGYSCTFKTGYGCTFNTYKFGYFGTTDKKNSVIIVRYDNNMKIYNLNDFESGKLIKFDIKSTIIKNIVETKLIDNSIMVINNTKELEGYTINKAQYVEDYFNDKESIIFTAQKDNYSAHGNTIKEAIADVQFKFMQSRGVQEHVKRVKELGIVTPNDYRLITGACRAGTDRFLKENNYTWESAFTIEEVKKIIVGQYGSEKFNQLM